MENTEVKYQILPVKTDLPYSLSDLSVVIPQASQYVRRIAWFIPQYVKNTPPEVLRNTVVVYDPEDELTKSVLLSNGVRGMTASPPHSTYKMMAGFMQVNTRLCVRMHNDAFIARDDWTQALVNQFNAVSGPQMIGAFNISGGLSEEYFQKMMVFYPALEKLYPSLAFSNNSIGACYLSAYFIAAQTYVMMGMYSQVLNLNEGKMDKEDVVLTNMTAFNQIPLTFWRNMYEFVANVGSGYGDFDETFKLPFEVKHKADGVLLAEPQFSPVL
jgi:hypothetical protein